MFLNDEECKKFNVWDKEHIKTCKIYNGGSGAIGGRMTYCFTPTSLGTVVKVKCACGEEVDVTAYEMW